MTFPDDPALALAANVDPSQDTLTRNSVAADNHWRAMRLALVLFPLAIIFFFGFDDLVRFTVQSSIERAFGNRGWVVVSNCWMNFAPIVLPILAGGYIGRKFPRRGAIGTMVALLILSAIGLPIFVRTFSAATEGYHPHGWRAGERYYAFSAAPVLFEPGLIICLVIGTTAAAITGKIKIAHDTDKR